ncbi:MAG: hypothetical protein LBQ28_06400 [Prevotellaceae bacterium]|jgi:hypothetical protein|nr:hypothetical protein [Prevotellaceae bacterium]
MKKTAALIFLLIANIIILLHAFVPHCDYNQMPADLLLSGYNAEIDNHCCSADACHHSHDIAEDCLLTQNYVNRIGNDEETIASDNFILLSYPLISVDYPVTVADSEFLSFQYKPYLLSYYSAFIVSGIGLRAPPVC